MVSRPCQCSLAAARAIDGGGSFAQIRQWGRGVELRLLRLHLRLGLWDLLLGAAVVVGFGVVQWGGHGLLVLVGLERGGAEGLVGVLVRGACLHGGDGRLALIDAVVDV